MCNGTCFKGSRTSCDVIISGIFWQNFGQKRSHHVTDAFCRAMTIFWVAIAVASDLRLQKQLLRFGSLSTMYMPQVVRRTPWDTSVPLCTRPYLWPSLGRSNGLLLKSHLMFHSICFNSQINYQPKLQSNRTSAGMETLTKNTPKSMIWTWDPPVLCGFHGASDTWFRQIVRCKSAMRCTLATHDVNRAISEL